MKASVITTLLAQALAVSALQKYCNGGQGLASGNTCEVSVQSLCAAQYDH